jgi:uncharacterized glyoxalase superfamily protein PhnB
MAVINPYIRFNGNAEEAFTFYKSVFGGAFEKIAHTKTYQALNSRLQKMMEMKSWTLLCLG